MSNGKRFMSGGERRARLSRRLPGVRRGSQGPFEVACGRRPGRRIDEETGIATVLDAHRAWIVERAPQVNYSARILHQELRSQRGFAGSYETVKLAVRRCAQKRRSCRLTQRRFETGPGEQAQIDWGQVTVSFGGQRSKVHIFVMTLGYSRRGYAERYEQAHSRPAGCP
ncbi:MAG: hypothetical protein U1E96_11965 [Azonexus sp.]